MHGVIKDMRHEKGYQYLIFYVIFFAQKIWTKKSDHYTPGNPPVPQQIIKFVT